MAWITPKTDWKGSRDINGVYTGDYFNASDYNRIKNNISHLRDMALALYDNFELSDMGNDRTPADYLYADDINQLEGNLRTIITKTINDVYPRTPIRMANEPMITFMDLNALERRVLETYEKLMNVLNERRTFTWNFGERGGVL